MIWLLQHTQKFPKHERFRLAKQIDDAFFSFHACLLHAVKTAQTRQQLQQADVELDKLRAYLRIALELKYTTPEQFQFVSEHIAEIGRLLGGWIKKA